MRKSYADKIHAKRIYDDLVTLCKFGAKEGQVYGSRAAGSQGDLDAADWIADIFESADLKVTREPFESIVYHEHESYLEVLGEKIPARAFFYSPPTSAAGVTAEITCLNFGEEEDYIGVDVKGKIVLIRRDDTALKENFWDEMVRAKEHGVAGVVMVDYSDCVFIPTFETGYFDPEKRLRTYESDFYPAMVIGATDGGKIYDACKEKTVTAKLFIDAYFGPGNPVNVHAVKEGTDLKHEKILIYSHRDSVGNPGAADNGTGQVCMTELVRILKDEKFRRTVEFISLDHEEQLACLGSKFYLEQHKDELSSIKASFELDMPLGPGMMVITGGDFRELQIHYPKYLVDYCVNVADQLGYVMERGWAGLGTPDSGRINQAGVPTVWFWAHAIEEWMHTGQDVPEKLDINSLKPFTEVMASIIYELANCDDVDKVIGKE